MTRVSAGETAVEHDGETGEVAVFAGDDRLLAGRVVATERGQTEADTGADTGLRTSLDCRPADCGEAVELTLTVENPGTEPVRLDELRLLDRARTPFGPDDAVYEHGYQSWSPTATLRLGERFPEASARARPQMVDLTAPEDARTSHAVTALSGDAGTVTLGFLDHEQYLSRFDLRTEPVSATDSASAENTTTTLTALCPADGVRLAPGESRESATLRIDAGRGVRDALAGIAESVADRLDARVPASAPTGWCSWYHYFTDVTADDIAETVAALDDWSVPLDLVQLDDGYQVAFGDWRTLAEGFDDMRALRESVADAGHTPGLWLAPFYVQADSLLAQEHPEWLLTSEGDPVDAGARHGPMYALDTTHPAVESWLTETVETVVDDWGFDYLKLDFLYCAALPGDRTRDLTRAEAYRHGLATIREAVGDTTILGCGAPQFASVGLVDAMRIGPDTAPYWRRDGDSASQPAHENAVRNVLNRQLWHRRLWLNDPDCQLVRTTTDLTDAERESFAALVALLGGTNVLSDAIREIDAPGRRLFERTLPPVETGAVADFGEREFPRTVVLRRPADGGCAVAAFNWADESRSVAVDPSEYVDSDDASDDSGVATGIVALASGDHGARAGRLHREMIERDLPPHGVLVVHVAPARDRPHLAGADHLAGAGSQVTATEWYADTGTLSVTLDAERPMDVLVATPGAWRLADGADDETRTDDRADAARVEPHDGTTRVTLTPGANDFDCFEP
jgi:alpha-galactosidase